jgi:hypothetical protein
LLTKLTFPRDTHRRLLLGCCPGDLKTRLIALDADDRGDIELELVELLEF